MHMHYMQLVRYGMKFAKGTITFTVIHRCYVCEEVCVCVS